MYAFNSPGNKFYVCCGVGTQFFPPIVPTSFIEQIVPSSLIYNDMLKYVKFLSTCVLYDYPYKNRLLGT